MIATLSTYLLYLYTVLVYGALFFSIINIYFTQQNYFTTAIIYLDHPSTNFIMHNFVLATAILIYRAIVWIFFQESKQNQNIKITQKLKAKAIEILLLLYYTNGQLSLQLFSCVVFWILMFVVHTHAICRAQYLVHTPTLTTLSLNYRLLAMFFCLIFIDYEILKNFISWLASDNYIANLFIYYIITVFLSIIEPMVKYFADFYQKYTYTHIKKLDQHMVHISVFISIPRCLIQVLLLLWIIKKSGFINLFFIFSFIESVIELRTIFKSYQNMNKLKDTIKNLKKINEEEIKLMHDQICIFCMQDMKTAVILPCKHAFHQECLRQWILKNSNHFCPKCTKSFNFDTKSNEEQSQKRNRELQAQNANNQNRNQQVNNQQFNGDEKIRITQLINQMQHEQRQNADKKNQKAKKLENQKKQRPKKLKSSSMPYKRGHLQAQKTIQRYYSGEFNKQIKQQLKKAKIKQELGQERLNKEQRDIQSYRNDEYIQDQRNMQTIDYDDQNGSLKQQKKHKQKRNNKFSDDLKSLTESQNSNLNEQDDQQYIDNCYYTTPKRVYQKQIGALPFGLPTEAIYRRQHTNMYKRKLKIRRNDQIIQLLKKSAIQQMLRLPQ